ncbi:hypothetical protein V2W45_1462227 [Cenococcum geophilum]
MSRPDYGTTPPASSSVRKRWASKEAKWKHNNITSDLPPGAQKKIVNGIWTASPPDHGVWTLLDRNDATKAIAAGAADEFYKLHRGGQIFAHSAAGEAWKLIDDSGDARRGGGDISVLVASGRDYLALFRHAGRVGAAGYASRNGRSGRQ